MSDLTLPELGENISAGDVLRVLVKPGDALAKDQPVLELETDKATIEVPSSLAGIVGEIKVKPGDKVKVGQVILTVADGSKPDAAASAKAEKAAGQQRQEGQERREGQEGRDGQERKAEKPEPKIDKAEP